MTDVLRETLEERGRATAWTDVDGLMAAGDRRVRRRRVAVGAATLAVLAAVGVAVPYVVSGLDGGADQGQVAVDDPDAAPVSWSTGSVVHVGDREVDLGTTPFAYVLTDAGVVWADRESGVWFTDLDGEGEQVGVLGAEASRLLVSDGPLAAWYDGDAAGFVVLDTTTGEVVREVPAPIDAQQEQAFGGGPEVRALDDGVLWYSVPPGDTGVDVTTGEATTLVRPAREGELADVRAGLLAVTGSDTTTAIRPSGEEVGSVPGDDGGLLSPDAGFVITTSQDVTSVWDVATGDDVTPEHGYDFFFAVRWLDDDTYEALGLADVEDPSGNDAPAGDVITCSVDDGGCEVVAEGAFSPGAPFSVPIGESTSD